MTSTLETRLIAKLIDNESPRSNHIHVLIPLEYLHEKYKYECVKCCGLFRLISGILKIYDI